MPEAEQNIVWNLFSGDVERIATAFGRLQPRLNSWSSLLNELLGHYGLEGIPMPYTMADFEREVTQKMLDKMTPEQRLAGLSPTQILEVLPVNEIENYLKRLKAVRDNNTTEHPETGS